MSIIRTLLVLFLFSVGLSRASPAVWGCLWQVLDRRGQVLGRLGLSRAGLGRVLGRFLGGSWSVSGGSWTSWVSLGLFWASLEPSWAGLGRVLGETWALLVGLGASWVGLGRVLGVSWAVLGVSWGVLGMSWAVLDLS